MDVPSGSGQNKRGKPDFDDASNSDSSELNEASGHNLKKEKKEKLNDSESSSSSGNSVIIKVKPSLGGGIDVVAFMKELKETFNIDEVDAKLGNVKFCNEKMLATSMFTITVPRHARNSIRDRVGNTNETPLFSNNNDPDLRIDFPDDFGANDADDSNSPKRYSKRRHKPNLLKQCLLRNIY